ncbi:metal ABC transporter ATP-binding protein [bacterium]|nr:metal ABC transporter ATP-binding protein [bacterium]
MASSKPLIELKDVTLNRGGRIALDSVSLHLDRRTLLGLIGPNGAGKTSLLKVILGELEPESGEVFLDGIPHKKALRERWPIGYLPQHHTFESLIPITGFEAVMMGRFGRMGIFRSPSEEDRKAVLVALERINALDLADKLISELSGGQIQRIFIARALASESPVLLLDEPEAGIDRETADRFMRLLSDLRDKLDLGIILVSHDIGMITRNADVVACINHKLHFHDKPVKLDGSALSEVFGEECELLIHSYPIRQLEGHDD